MFARVAFEDGQKAVVPIELIRHFDPKNYQKNKKFNVQWEDGNFYEGVVLSLGNTKEAAEGKNVHKRLSIPNLTYCESASELSDVVGNKSDISTLITKKATKHAPLREAARQRIARVHALKRQRMQAKRKTDEASTHAIPQKIRATISPKENPDAECSSSSENSRTEEMSIQDKGKTKETFSSPEDKENQNISVYKSGPPIRESESCFERGNEKSSAVDKSDPAISDKENPSEHGTKKASIVSEHRVPVRDNDSLLKLANNMIISTKENEHGSQRIRAPPKVVSDSQIKPAMELRRRQSSNTTITSGQMKVLDSTGLESLKKECKRLKEENSTLTTRSNKQAREIAKLKSEIEDFRVLHTESLRLTVDLQKTVIDNWEEMMESFRDIKQKNSTTFSRDGSLPPVGYENKQRMEIHVGCGIWVSSCQFNSLMSNKSPKMFVKELARVLYGKPVLLESTVTGKQSNRSKGKKKSGPPPKQLDPKKLNTVRAALQYYPADKRFDKLSMVTKDTHVYNLGHYIAEYISDLKKAAAKEQRAGNSLTVVNDGNNEAQNESNQSQNSENIVREDDEEDEELQEFVGSGSEVDQEDDEQDVDFEALYMFEDHSLVAEETENSGLNGTNSNEAVSTKNGDSSERILVNDNNPLQSFEDNLSNGQGEHFMDIDS